MYAGDEQRGAQQTRAGTLFRLAEQAAELLATDGAAVALAGPTGYVVESATALLAPLLGEQLDPAAVAPDPPRPRADAARAVSDASPRGPAAGRIHELTSVEHVLAIPVRLGERLQGALLVANAAGGPPFDEADGRVLRMLVDGAAASLETAHLRRELTDLERALMESNAELARAVRARDDFFSRMNHELRTPLNAVICYGELLRDAILGELNPKQHQAVERLHAAGRRLRSLVDDALDFCDLPMGDSLLATDPVDPGELAAEVVASLRSEADHVDLQLTVDSDSETAELELDGVRARRLILILCTRAVNLLERGTVSVRVRRVPEGIGIEVAGSGEVRTPAGADLELDSARRLAGRLGGRLTVEQPVAGSPRFLVVLPARVPANA